MFRLIPTILLLLGGVSHPVRASASGCSIPDALVRANAPFTNIPGTASMTTADQLLQGPTPSLGG